MKKISFVDKKQNLLWIVIDDTGSIVDSNKHIAFWYDYKVSRKRLKVGKPIWLRFAEAKDMPLSWLTVEKIEALKKPHALP